MLQLLDAGAMETVKASNRSSNELVESRASDPFLYHPSVLFMFRIVLNRRIDALRIVHPGEQWAGCGLHPQTWKVTHKLEATARYVRL